VIAASGRQKPTNHGLAAAERSDINFDSHGVELSGWLYRAPGPGPSPGIVMAHGLTAVKEMFLDRYAEAFQAAGLSTLVYDHFGFGSSAGEPRQWPSPSVQIEGYRDALRWLGDDAAIDEARLGIWGSSFSGGEVIMLAAEELALRCAVAQVPGLGDTSPEIPAGAMAAILEAVGSGRADVIIPAVETDPEGEGFMLADGAAAWFSRVAAERAPRWRNELRPLAFSEPYRPIDSLIDVRVPLLLIVARDDELTPPAGALAIAPTIDLVEVVEIPGGHFDAYEANFDASCSAATSFFCRQLRP